MHFRVDGLCSSTIILQITHRMAVQYADDIAKLFVMRTQWQELADSAVEPNPFFEPWALLPAFELLTFKGLKPGIVFVKATCGNLLGAFPVITEPGFKHLPLRTRKLWRHIHCFLCTPLLRKGREREALIAFLAWHKEEQIPLQLEVVASDGAFYDTLRGLVPKDIQALEEVQSYVRPLLQSVNMAETYLVNRIGRRRLRQFERKREALGAIQFEDMSCTLQIESAIEQFLELEKQGWKGRCGTALANKERDTEFFRRVILGGAQEGRVKVYALVSEGAPIAMRFDLLAGKAAFAFKISYDERFRRCSPGALLEIEVLRKTLQERSFEFIDSCTIPSPNSVHGYLWSESRKISSLILYPSSAFGSLLRGSVSAAKRAKQVAQAILHFPLWGGSLS